MPDANIVEGGGGASRTVIITPVGDGYGSALITMTVTDPGSATAVDTFTLTVDPVSDAPSSQTFGIQTDQDVDYVFGTAEFNFSDATDAGSDVDSFAAIVLASLPADGTLILNDGAVDQPITGLPFPPITTSDITLGRFKFRPDPGESGTPYTSFTFQVQDTGSTANGGVIVSIPYTLNVDVLPVAGTEPLLPYLTGAGELKLFDPANPASPVLVASGLPTTGFVSQTLLQASGTGTTATSIHASKLIYIHDDGTSRRIWRVDLEPGVSHTPAQVSNITDACDFNGVAEDIRTPTNGIVRVDTAGSDGLCNTSDDFATAETWLVPVTTPGAAGGTQIGFGNCCGIAGIADANGNLVGVLTTEDDGTGSTFDLRRRNVADLSTPVFTQSLDIAGSGQTYSRVIRGFGDQAIYIRANPTDADPKYKLLRFNVAGNTLTELFDYGVTDGIAFTSALDTSTVDATNLYFTSADGSGIFKIAHAATGTGQEAALVTSPGFGNTTNLEQTTSRIVFQTSGASAGVYSVPKAGGSVIPIATDSLSPLRFNLLGTTDNGRVYVSVNNPGGAPEHEAHAFLDDGSPVTNVPDAAWAGKNFQTTCDFSASCEDTIAAQAIFVRLGASTTTAAIELVDPATSTPTGDFFQSVLNVSQGPSVFAVGFGRYTQFTFFSTAGNTDVWLGDIQAAGPGGPAGSILVASAGPGDDRWLLFGGDDGGGAPATCSAPPAGLISWYPGDGDAFDIQGGRHGTLNGAGFNTGKVAQAFTFDGVDDYVDVADGPAVPQSGITLDAWVNFSSAAGNQMIVTRDLSGLGEAYILLRNGNTLEADAHDAAGNGAAVTAAFVPTPGTWYHVAYTFDDASDLQALYVNGSLVANNLNTSLIGYDLSSMTIGADVEPGPTVISFFQGLIDEVEMFGRALSQPEIQAIVTAGSAGKCKPGAASDLDGDGLSFALEISLGTNPNSPDTDADGAGDGLEIAVASSALIVNATIRVSGSGDDANVGTSWDNLPAGTGPVLTNARVVQLLDALAPYPPALVNQFIVLYDSTATPGALNLADGATRNFVTFVGSVGPSQFVPQFPPTTSFDALGSGSTVEVSNGLELRLKNVNITGGSAPDGAGVLVHDLLGQATVTLDHVRVHNNAASANGGGVAVIGSPPTRLTVQDSEIQFNTVTSASAAWGGGAYANGTNLDVFGTTINNNTATGVSVGVARGGGIYTTSNSTLVVSNSRVRDNTVVNAGSGGRGGGIYAGISTDLTLSDSAVTGNLVTGGGPDPSYGGGGVWAGPGDSVNISGTTFANNTANNGPGGGINLIDTAFVTVADSMFLSNRSLRPGGGLHIHPTNDTSIFNNLFLGNVSTDTVTDGGGVEIENLVAHPNVDFNSNTVAWNQTPNNLTDAGGGVSFSVFVNFHNSIVWFNQNSSPGTTDTGDNMRFDGSVGASANNVQDPGMPASTPTLPRFQQGFYLDPITPSLSINTGDNAFAGPLLGFPYTTNPDGSGDSAPLDKGFHYRGPSAGAMTSVTDAPPFACSVDVIIFRPRFANAGMGDPGHLIAVEFSGPAGVTLSSLTTIAPRGGSSRIARDLGDGRYAVNVGGPPATGTGTFSIYADDQATPRTFQVEFGC
ncbi:MAG: LamG-like jellyroll fold domain-containing protein [Nevskiaceae bacterium]